MKRMSLEEFSAFVAAAVYQHISSLSPPLLAEHNVVFSPSLAQQAILNILSCRDISRPRPPVLKGTFQSCVKLCTLWQRSGLKEVSTCKASTCYAFHNPPTCALPFITTPAHRRPGGGGGGGVGGFLASSHIWPRQHEEEEQHAVMRQQREIDGV